MNGKSALGAILVVLGGLMVLKFLGIPMGWLFGLLMPFILIGLGVVGVKNDKKVIGTILIVVGGIMLFGKMLPLIFLLVAIGIIVWGLSMFKRERRV
jgi:lia operon protein LiaI